MLITDETPKPYVHSDFPACYYGPNGQSEVFKHVGEVPEGWCDNPADVGKPKSKAANVVGSRTPPAKAAPAPVTAPVTVAPAPTPVLVEAKKLVEESGSASPPTVDAGDEEKSAEGDSKDPETVPDAAGD